VTVVAVVVDRELTVTSWIWWRMNNSMWSRAKGTAGFGSVLPVLWFPQWNMSPVLCLIQSVEHLLKLSKNYDFNSFLSVPGRYQVTREDQVDQERTGGAQSTKTYERWGSAGRKQRWQLLTDTDGDSVGDSSNLNYLGHYEKFWSVDWLVDWLIDW